MTEAAGDAILMRPAGIATLAAYLVVLLGLGFAGRRARRENSLADFYLAGRSMGLFTLFLTLYATQYSGNNLLGFAAQSYRSGFTFFVSVSFMLSIIVVYWLYAPALQRLARTHNYITPGDYIRHRYGSGALVVLLNLIFILVLAGYILTNLKAVGYLVETTTGGQVPYAAGIIGLSLLMVVYETLGGMRSVAWTDALQGLTLLLGCLVIVIAMDYQYDGLQKVTSTLMTVRPDFWTPPDLRGQAGWFSLLLLVAFGAAVYPQAIQRIYAARDEAGLRRALQLMLVMPWITTFVVFLFGIVGAARFPALADAQSEHIALLLLNDLGTNVPVTAFLIVVFIAAIIAAIMSTVDSALLAISSLFTQDMARPLAPRLSQERLTLVGKLLSWGIMALIVLAALYLPQTIWKITVFKLELLIQAAPAMLLGIATVRPGAAALIAGVCVGVLVTFYIKYAPGLAATPLGINSGIWGVLANLACVGLVTLTERRWGRASAPIGRP
jgi:SSS family transporter